MSSLKSISLFFPTVRHLRSKQIKARLRNRLSPLFVNTERFCLQAVPEFRGCSWSPRLGFLPPAEQNNSAPDLITGKFCFLNNKQELGWPPVWTPARLPKLWIYNLHYFDYLWFLDYVQAKSVVLDWIEKYGLRAENIGWQPYPTSCRLINFCAVFFGKYRQQTEADRAFLRKLWESIYIQAQWLSRNFEIHLLGNHLFENAAALAFAGSCFSGTAADKWFQVGTHILEKEIQEQILDDGMHFERSPMYHCRIAYLLCLLLNIKSEKLEQIVTEPLKRMIKFLQHLAHPDGNIALLNDSAFGIYNKPEELTSYSNKLLGQTVHQTNLVKPGLFALPDAGYYGVHTEDGSYLICDAAPIGPDYIPGHAHSDIFSFELSLRGHRVIVDSGVYDYEISRMRQYCRSTKAHNTVEIAAQDQCEMWSAFRVARRGRPYDVKWLPNKSGFRLSAWHDGYRRLKGSPVHHREFIWNNPGDFTIKDTISATRTQTVISRLHLHPDCKIDQLKNNTAWITYPAGKFKIAFWGNGRLVIEDSYYCPEFGLKIVNQALAFSLTGLKIKAVIRIEGC